MSLLILTVEFIKSSSYVMTINIIYILRFVIKYIANCDHKLAIHKSTPHKHVHVFESSGAMSHSKN